MTLVTHRISTIDGHFPTTAQLADGELAVNVRNGLIFLKRVVGTTETVEKFLPASQMYLLEQQANLITDPIPAGFLRVFSYNGYLYIKVGNENAKMMITLVQFQSLIESMSVIVPTQFNISDVGGITECDISQLSNAEIFINENVATFSTLSLINFDINDGSRGVIFIKAPNSSYRLKIPAYTAGQLLLSDDVWAWDNFNNTSKSITEYITGPPTYATFTCTHHSYTTGSYVKIAGYSGNKSSYNGVHKLTSVDLNTFRIDVAYQSSGTASSPTVILQEKVFNITDYNNTYMYDYNYDCVTEDLYISLKNKVKRY